MDSQTTWRWEQLSPILGCYASPEHGFGVDAFLLSRFAAPRPRDRVCDLGTGCGIVPLLWYRKAGQGPQDCWCVDLQPQAIAQLEAAILAADHLAGRLHPLCADLRRLEGVPIPVGQLDLVTCNPPYFPQNGGPQGKRAARSLARHEAACTLEEVCQAAAQLLRTGGRACLCLPPRRLTDLLTALRAAGLEPKQLQLVQYRSSRSPWLALAEGRKGAAPGLELLPPFLLQWEDGTPTPDAASLYG